MKASVRNVWKSGRLSPAPWVLLAAVALVVRAGEIHSGLIYPDGYDYLLMARGIASHLQPTTHLGPGGVLFSPPLDAALKPLFPALVALLSALMSLRHAADLLTALAGAAVVVLCALVAARLTRSPLAAVVAGLAALCSPALGYWGGFVGPDMLAPALALAALLLILHDRPVPAGIVAALSVAARPEWLLAWAIVALSLMPRRENRAALANAAIAGVFTVAVILAALQPPLGANLSLGGSTVGGIVHSHAVAQFARDDWPLLVLALIGLARGCAGAQRRPALTLAGVVFALALVYLHKNAGSERYLAQLVPLLALLASFALLSIPWRVAALIATSALLALLLFTTRQPPLGADPFTTVASRVGALGRGPLITAAPAAYGWLLPARAIEPMRAGERGVVILDGARRSLLPHLHAAGTVLARIALPDGYERPDGTIDHAPALIVQGVVTR